MKLMEAIAKRSTLTLPHLPRLPKRLKVAHPVKLVSECWIEQEYRAVDLETRHLRVKGNKFTWFIRCGVPNPGDYLIAHDREYETGFSGQTLTLPLTNGKTVKVRGPWIAGSLDLYADTGLDLRATHLTRVVICGKYTNGYKQEDVYYWEEKPILGYMGRGNLLVQEWVKKFKVPLFGCIYRMGGDTSKRYFPLDGEWSLRKGPGSQGGDVVGVKAL